MISIPTPSTPQPGTPPNPPMYGQDAAGQAIRQRKIAQGGQGYGATILGQGNPTNTGQKTLLGGG